jgi:hypothetical protein
MTIMGDVAFVLTVVMIAGAASYSIADYMRDHYYNFDYSVFEN